MGHRGNLNTDSATEDLQELKDAIIELYLAIKIRSTEEVRNKFPSNFTPSFSWTK